jgi:hypothetical protein
MLYVFGQHAKHVLEHGTVLGSIVRAISKCIPDTMTAIGLLKNPNL